MRQIRSNLHDKFQLHSELKSLSNTAMGHELYKYRIYTLLYKDKNIPYYYKTSRYRQKGLTYFVIAEQQMAENRITIISQ